MKSLLTILILATTILTLAPACRADDTFSIVAVDPATQQVGSAGASCIAGAIMISDVHPGVGAIHTQAYYNRTNQLYGHSLMDRGFAPQTIIDSLVARDAGHNPNIRQYGVVDLVGGGRSAAYTGSGCSDWKGHITGPNYAIQGNILLGPQIVQNIESNFRGTLGSLADKLMSGLQGAKVPGADTRCMQYGKSTISAFLRVAKPGDPEGSLYLDLNVNDTPTNQDPIDVLQQLYDDWRMQASGVDGPPVTVGPSIKCEPNPFVTGTTIRYRVLRAGPTLLRILDATGREVARPVEKDQDAGFYAIGWEPDSELPNGLYFCVLRTGGSTMTGRLLLLKSGR